jgi:hypothetical protein
MFVEKLVAQKRFNARYHLHQILELAKLYHKHDFEAALTVSLEYNVFTVNFLSGYLEKNFKHSFDLQRVATGRSELPAHAAVTCNLADYHLADGPHAGTDHTTVALSIDPASGTDAHKVSTA